MDSMIKVEDVSMKFNLGIEKNFSLKLFFINMFKPKKKDEKKGNKDFWALKHVILKWNGARLSDSSVGTVQEKVRF